MALPKINENYKFVTVPLPSNQTIGVKSWKVKDEKELLFSIESEENITPFNKNLKIISMLKDCCVDDKTKFNKFSESDIRKICVEARKLSKGDELEFNTTCGNCGAAIFDVINLTTSQKMKTFDLSPAIINDKLTVTFKDLGWEQCENIKKKHSDSARKYAYYYILNSIDSITYEGATYTEFNESEIINFVDDLNPMDIEKLYEQFHEKSSYFMLEHSTTCFSCKEEIDINFGDLLSFLVL